MSRKTRLIAAGSIAGAVNGLFGAGGGMVLVPLLRGIVKLPEICIFPSSVCIILPICAISAFISLRDTPIDIRLLLPYLIGGTIGGLLAGLFGRKIPNLWLRRIFGIIILWGGIRYLC